MKELVEYKPKWKQSLDDSKILSSVSTNMKDARAWKKTKIDDKIKKWESDYQKDPIGNESKGRSDLIDDTIHNYCQAVITNIAEPLVGTADIVRLTSNSVNDNVTEQAKAEEALLNYQFANKVDKFAVMDEGAKLFVRHGVRCAKVYWEHKVKQIVADSLYDTGEGSAEYKDLSTNEYEDLLIAHKANKEYPVGIDVDEDLGTMSVTFVYDNIISENPNIYNIPISNMFWNETAKQVSYTKHDFSFAGEIKVQTESEIRSKLASDKKTYRSFTKEELDKLFKSKDSSELYTESAGFASMDGDIDAYYTELSKEILGTSATESHVVIEYHGYMDVDEDNIAELVHIEICNGIILKLVRNTEINDMIPYNVSFFDKSPFEMTGESIPSYLKDVQSLRTTMDRAMQDSTAYGLNQNYAMEEGAMSPVQFKKFRNRKPGDTFTFKRDRMGGDLKNRLVNIKSEGLNQEHLMMYQMAGQKAQENSGISTNSQGMSSESLTQTATEASIVQSAAMKRMWRTMTTFIETDIKRMITAFRIMNKTLLDPVEFKHGNSTYSMSRSDIDIDSDITTSVVVKGFDTQRVNQLIQFLQFSPQLVQMGAIPVTVVTECVKQLVEVWDMREIQKMVQAVQVPQQTQNIGGQGTPDQPSAAKEVSATNDPSMDGNNTINHIQGA